MNEKLNVAVLFGGCSDEYSVSLHSAAGVLRALDPGRYTVVKIGIDPQGDWFLTSASAAEIEADQWHTASDQRLQLTLARRGFELKDETANPWTSPCSFPFCTAATARMERFRVCLNCSTFLLSDAAWTLLC